MRRVGGTAAALVLVALAAAPAAPAATLRADRTCVAEGETATFTGSGFPASETFPLTFTRPGRDFPLRQEQRETGADGAIRFAYRFPRRSSWFDGGETRFPLTVSLIGARAELAFVRRDVDVSRTIAPDRPVVVRARGFASRRGRPLYAHWLRGGRRVRSLRLGTLAGACGSLTRRLARGFPFRPVEPGTWHVAFNTAATDPRAPGTVTRRAARVKRRIS